MTAVSAIDNWTRLPEPVARYLAFALPSEWQRITHAHLRFTGTFAAKPDAWTPFTADQDIWTDPPEFVWDARIAMLPLLRVHVRDSYTNGKGAMRATVGGLIRIVDQHGTPEIAAAALQRVLAEAVWVPTALAPRPGLVWSPIDDTTSRVTLIDGPSTVSLDMTFGASGEIVGTSGMRFRDVKGRPVLTRWVGEHREYRRIENMMIPTSGEVAWVVDEGRVPYWRGRLVEVRFDR